MSKKFQINKDVFVEKYREACEELGTHKRLSAEKFPIAEDDSIEAWKTLVSNENFELNSMLCDSVGPFYSDVSIPQYLENKCLHETYSGKLDGKGVVSAILARYLARHCVEIDQAITAIAKLTDEQRKQLFETLDFTKPQENQPLSTVQKNVIALLSCNKTAKKKDHFAPLGHALLRQNTAEGGYYQTCQNIFIFLNECICTAKVIVEPQVDAAREISTATDPNIAQEEKEFLDTKELNQKNAEQEFQDFCQTAKKPKTLEDIFCE